jgi:ABC-type nickel/cobalt efflux system permease component RcnA
MWSVLVLGLLLGMRHALEADHLAAVASLSTGGGNRGSIMLRGATWGFGHTVALLAAGIWSIALRLAVPAGPWLERGVGVMLALLGANVLVRLRRDRVHVHVHRHAGGNVHVHAHRHANDDVHSADHRHAHSHRLDLRALGVGMVHGLAGSAALLLVIASSMTSPWLGLAYIVVFGAGSIAGMTVLSAVIAWPLDASVRRLARAYTSVELLIAVGTIALGLAMLR